MIDTLITDNILLLNDTIAKISHDINITIPKDNNSQLLTNSITIFIGLIAGLIALYQVKSNVISSARIKWIENLRLALSEYCVEAINTATILQNFLEEAKGKSEKEVNLVLEKHYNRYFESHAKTDNLGKKVILFLNSKEANHSKIEETIKKISIHIDNEKLSDIDREKLENYVDEIIVLSKDVFKKEWEKSKSLFRI